MYPSSLSIFIFSSHVNECHRGRRGFEEILKAFCSENCPLLKTLNVGRNEIGEVSDTRGEQQTSVSIATICHLVELDLSQCGLSGSFVQTFFVGLELNGKTKLKKLYLHGNPLGSQGFTGLIPLLSASLLEQLNISDCQVGDGAMEKLSKLNGDPTSDNFQIWDLSNNGITTKGINLLSVRLRNAAFLTKLVTLNLAGNVLGDEGVKQLAKALQSRHSLDSVSTLTHLDLSNTQCGPQGAIDIIRLGRLKELHLFNNKLGSDGFLALAPTLRGGHSTLELLDLGGNGADQAAVVVLLSALIEASETAESNVDCGGSLKVLIVGGNESGDAVEQIVGKIRKQNPSLDIARDKKQNQRN
jgi:hypothetical protein